MENSKTINSEAFDVQRNNLQISNTSTDSLTDYERKRRMSEASESQVSYELIDVTELAHIPEGLQQRNNTQLTVHRRKFSLSTDFPCLPEIEEDCCTPKPILKLLDETQDSITSLTQNSFGVEQPKTTRKRSLSDNTFLLEIPETDALDGTNERMLNTDDKERLTCDEMAYMVESFNVAELDTHYPTVDIIVDDTGQFFLGEDDIQHNTRITYDEKEPAAPAYEVEKQDASLVADSKTRNKELNVSEKGARQIENDSSVSTLAQSLVLEEEVTPSIRSPYEFFHDFSYAIFCIHYTFDLKSLIFDILLMFV